jgi:hypothetical protein
MAEITTSAVHTAHCDPHFAPDGTCWCPCAACMPAAARPGDHCGCEACPCHPEPVREVGQLRDTEGSLVVIGADCDAVTLQAGYGLTVRLDAAGRDLFMRHWCAAERAAEAWAKEHGESPQTETRCTVGACPYEADGLVCPYGLVNELCREETGDG